MEEVTLMTREVPGTAEIDNYAEIKVKLAQAMERYQNLIYTEENYKYAVEDRKKLNHLKNELAARRKEIKASYMAPYQQVEKQFKELEALIEEPLAKIKTFINDTQNDKKAKKKAEIYAYYRENAAVLGSSLEVIWQSTGFLEEKWLNASTSGKTWQEEVDAKIRRINEEIQILQKSPGENKAPVLQKYLEKLDLEEALEYEKAWQNPLVPEIEGADAKDEIGYKVLKIYGTAAEMEHILREMRKLQMAYEELEDGMPKIMEEITEPIIDSFVCFDLENSGSFGAEKGDAPAEITEIGAVKVINGEIVDRQDWLCNPGRKIVPRVARMTHITDEMVKDAPPAKEVVREFLAYVGELPLLGHNIKDSDLYYIKKAAQKCGIALRGSYFDTLRYARKLKDQQGWTSLKLGDLASALGVELKNAHRASADAEATAQVYFKLQKLKQG